MPRATTKDDLLAAADAQFAKLWQLIGSMSPQMQQAPFRFDSAPLIKQTQTHWQRDKNVRDVLVHLYEWHRLLLDWIRANQGGQPAPFLPAPYNWKTYGQMNVMFWEKHQSTPYPDAVAMLRASHAEVMQVIGTFSNDELFAKGCLSWTGGSTLGSYCVSATASHYDWAMTKVKQHIKLYQPEQ